MLYINSDNFAYRVYVLKKCTYPLPYSRDKRVLGTVPTVIWYDTTYSVPVPTTVQHLLIMCTVKYFKNIPEYGNKIAVFGFSLAYQYLDTYRRVDMYLRVDTERKVKVKTD